MKIANSDISMSAGREFMSYSSGKKVTVETNDSGSAKIMNSVAAIYESSEISVGNSVVLTPGQYQYQSREQRAEEQRSGEREQSDIQSNARRTNRIPQPMRAAADFTDDIADIYDIKASLLNKMLELLNGKGKMRTLGPEELKTGNILDLRGPASRAAGMKAQLFGVNGPHGFVNGLTVGTTSAGTVWRKITTESGIHAESEYTSFQSRGFAVTEDGRSIDIDVAFSMSRSFTAKYESLTSESFIMTDPLIINLDSNVTSVSDVKFKFDLDSDGREESISFAGEGSGFLALDKNNNGVIDDGSELFGTKSGDGFADLADYDEDGNHWIDENDSVYAKLRVWTKDADGNDKLMDLKEANVGAIYLGGADTEFSLNNAATNETNGIIRRTGIYLKETGEAGTLSHVDLRC